MARAPAVNLVVGLLKAGDRPVALVGATLNREVGFGDRPPILFAFIRDNPQLPTSCLPNYKGKNVKVSKTLHNSSVSFPTTAFWLRRD